jgi:hypothetical protein
MGILNAKQTIPCLSNLLQKIKKAILIIYANDIILTGDYGKELVKLKKLLAKEFEIKNLGYLIYFLGMEVARSRKGIYVLKENISYTY